ncbi:luciferin 4-monooxygenase-like [Thrips palmi]|uniref:Luciferin 4-monooxygenase-like n=1 Tax=Thrips palmi TaxID=161013 RepID=A0A6P8ZZJ4_THRPL|nr:luciferin 4-monooxygenase-like [Thrips palmi]
MGLACSCGDMRVVSAVSVADRPPAEAEPEAAAVADGLMDDDGVIRGADGPEADVSLGEFLLQHLREHAAAQRVAQVDASTGDVWSFQTLLSEAVQVASALAEDGLGPGDTIAFFSKNYHELYGGVLGCVLAGITVATMVPTHGPAELKHQLLLCMPKAIFVEAELLPRTQEALDGFPADVRVFTLQTVADDEVTSYAALSERGFDTDPDAYSPAEIPDRKSHVAFILYSSGTTGLPKGVQIPNHGLTTMIMNVSGLPTDLEGVGDVLTVLVLAPISWISGVVLLLKATQVGARRVSMANPVPKTVLSCLQTYKVNVWPTAPSVLLGLVHHPARRLFNFSSIKCILSGGGPLSAELQEEVSRKLGCLVVQGYGSTEMGILVTASPGQNKPGSLGVIEDKVSVRLVDLDTNEVIREPGRVGEMRARGPCNMIGYIGNPEATAECYDEEGWFKTGDLVYFDSDGFFFYVDRLKEMIKYKSHQVAPTEVEALLVTHPAVRDACVMGIPNLMDGEHPMAFVVRSKKVEAQELQDFVAQRLSEPKHLRGGIIFLDSIPRTVTGKTQRAALKKILAERREE